MINSEVPIYEAIENKNRVPIQITLIMMTRNRQKHIKPLLNYYSDYPIHLIIADGSDSAFVPPPIPKGAHSAFQISYVHDARAESYITRLSASLKLTMTSLVLLVPDDEIFLWGGIKEAINVINADSTIASAGGSSTLCRKFGNSLSYVSYLNYGFSPRDFWYNEDWTNLQIDSPKVLVRVMQVVASPFLHRFHIYRVVRVEVIKKFISIASQVLTLKGQGLFEFIFTLSVHLYGKSYVSKTPFWIRTLKSDNGWSTDLGQHGEKELQSIIEWTVGELEANSTMPVDIHIQENLEKAIMDSVGPSSAFTQVLHEYVRIGRLKLFKFKLKVIIEKFAPLLSKFIANRNLVDKFRFDKQNCDTLGFTQIKAKSKEEQEQFTKAAKALNSILG